MRSEGVREQNEWKLPYVRQREREERSVRAAFLMLHSKSMRRCRCPTAIAFVRPSLASRRRVFVLTRNLRSCSVTNPTLFITWLLLFSLSYLFFVCAIQSSTECLKNKQRNQYLGLLWFCYFVGITAAAPIGKFWTFFETIIIRGNYFALIHSLSVQFLKNSRQFLFFYYPFWSNQVNSRAELIV